MPAPHESNTSREEDEELLKKGRVEASNESSIRDSRRDNFMLVKDFFRETFTTQNTLDFFSSKKFGGVLCLLLVVGVAAAILTHNSSVLDVIQSHGMNANVISQVGIAIAAAAAAGLAFFGKEKIQDNLAHRGEYVQPESSIFSTGADGHSNRSSEYI